MFQDSYVDRTPETVAKDFGPSFAQGIFALMPGGWSGPIQSGYGWHLVFVDAIVPERMPALSEIKPQVRADWLEARTRELKDKALEEIRSRYIVVLPDLNIETMRAVLSGRSRLRAKASHELPDSPLSFRPLLLVLASISITSPGGR